MLRDCQFDPREKTGPNAVIVDVIISNPDFGESRAIEEIGEAVRILHAPAANPEKAKENREEYDRRMKNAIGLLALTLAVRG